MWLVAEWEVTMALVRPTLLPASENPSPGDGSLPAAYKADADTAAC